MVENNPGRAGEIAMALLGKDIPAIGSRLKSKTDAMLAVKEFVRAIEGLLKGSNQPYRVMFLRQSDGRYMMVIKGSRDTLELLHNFDELTVKRFQRSFKKRLFIITGFFEDGDDLECLALTEGLGAVMYVP